MVVVVSRFRVANGMQTDVERAFQERPRSVEQAPGFLWLEVFVDRDDASVFYLVTRWTDQQSFESWHNSPAHRDSHAFIPKGLKLDPTWTKIFDLLRIDGATGSPLADALVDSTLLFSEYVAGATGLHLFVMDRGGTIETCNPIACAELAGGAALSGRSVMDFMPQADAARLRELLTVPGRLTTPVTLNFAASNRVPYSLNCWIDVRSDSATLIGEPVFRRDLRLQDDLMAINQELAALSRERSREVRDERFGREAAEKLNRERNAFLNVLAHELRQPLGSALAAMSVLRQLNPDPNLEQTRQVLERQLKQITRLVEDLADTARVAAGKVELRRTDVDLVALIKNATSAWETNAQQQRKPFTHDVPSHPLIVNADADRLQQIFSNLVTNAFKYTPAGRTVSLTLTQEGRAAVVSVRDAGEGIAPEQLPRVFELFQRATTTGAGLGVGLAVVKALVEAHGGTVTADSGGLGKGATFTVRLPLAR